MSLINYKKIRSLRTKKGYSLRKFASVISLSPSYLSDIELGKVDPSIGTLSCIADKLEVPISMLIVDSCFHSKLYSSRADNADNADNPIELCLRGLKEAKEFCRAVDPESVLADGITPEEKTKIWKEGTEARNAIDAVLKVIGDRRSAKSSGR